MKRDGASSLHGSREGSQIAHQTTRLTDDKIRVLSVASDADLLWLRHTVLQSAAYDVTGANKAYRSSTAGPNFLEQAIL